MTSSLREGEVALRFKTLWKLRLITLSRTDIFPFWKDHLTSIYHASPAFVAYMVRRREYNEIE